MWCRHDLKMTKKFHGLNNLCILHYTALHYMYNFEVCCARFDASDIKHFLCLFIDIKPHVMPLKFRCDLRCFFPLSQCFAVTDFILSALAAREENLHQLPPSALLLDWQLGGAHHGGHPPDGGGDAARAGGGENDICTELWSKACLFSSIAFVSTHPWQTSLFPAVQIMKRCSFHCFFCFVLVHSWMVFKGQRCHFCAFSRIAIIFFK